VVTHVAEDWARHLTSSPGWQVALTTLAYLGVSAVFFVLKFVIYETVVFTKVPEAKQINALAESSVIIEAYDVVED